MGALVSVVWSDYRLWSDPELWSETDPALWSHLVEREEEEEELEQWREKQEFDYLANFFSLT